MKHFKRMLAVALTMFLAFALAIPAFAAGEGTITIKDTEKGTEYEFYKVLDLAGSDTSSPADGKFDIVTYSTNTKWEGFFTSGAGAGYLVDTDPTNSLNQITVSGATKYLNLTESNVVAFANDAMKYALANSIAPETSKTSTEAGSDIEVDGLDLGYYLIIPVDASDPNSHSSGSLASLISTMPEADIYVKAKKPEIEKVDDKITVDVGQKVTYTLTGVVPDTSGYSTYKYVMNDVMTSGLTFNKDVKVEVNGTDVTDDCTIDYTSISNGFSCDIPVMDLQANKGKAIVLTYTAFVNESAVEHSQEKNKAQLKYGHDPNDLEEGLPVEEEVYTAKVIIHKFDDKNAPLADAQFALMNSEGKYYKYTAPSGTDPAKVEWVTVSGAPASGSAPVTEAGAQALVAAATAGTITAQTTNASGEATFIGVADGTYYLVEIAAPTGYSLLTVSTAVTVEGKDADAETPELENHAQAGQTVFDEAQNGEADVVNRPGHELPSTGGMGTTILYVVGGIMMLAGAVMFFTKRRVASMEN